MQPPFPRDQLATPALTIELGALTGNIAAMAAWARAAGVVLRPHAKTHKCAEIARRQIAAGAVGVCCAKLGEAEALAAAGIDDILITSPVVSAPAVARLAALAPAMRRLAVVVDHPEALARIAATGVAIDIVIDIDPGFHRTGVVTAEAAVALARAIVASDRLQYRGVQFYCGTLQHVAGRAERLAAVTERTAYLTSILETLAAAGLPAATVTGGGTGSFAIDAELGVLNELQPGSYIFMDGQYSACEPAGQRFEPSLAIDTRVVSANHPGHVTIDAGLKAMATEAGPPMVIAGADAASRYRFMGDEHGRLDTPDGMADPAIDARITLMPPHCDPTVNLYDHYAVCEGETVVALWPVTARGRSG